MSSEDPKFAKRMAERRALSQPDGNQVSPVPTDDRGDTQAAGSAAAHKRTSRGLVSDQEFLAQQKVRIGDLQSPLPGEESASGSPEKTVWVSYGTGPVDRQAQQSSRPSSAAGSSLSNISTSRTHSAQDTRDAPASMPRQLQGKGRLQWGAEDRSASTDQPSEEHLAAGAQALSGDSAGQVVCRGADSSNLSASTGTLSPGSPGDVHGVSLAPTASTSWEVSVASPSGCNSVSAEKECSDSAINSPLRTEGCDSDSVVLAPAASFQALEESHALERDDLNVSRGSTSTRNLEPIQVSTDLDRSFWIDRGFNVGLELGESAAMRKRANLQQENEELLKKTLEVDKQHQDALIKVEKNADTLSKKSEKSHKEIFELKARLAERESLRESEGAQGSAAQNEREKITQELARAVEQAKHDQTELHKSRDEKERLVGELRDTQTIIKETREKVLDRSDLNLSRESKRNQAVVAMQSSMDRVKAAFEYGRDFGEAAAERERATLQEQVDELERRGQEAGVEFNLHLDEVDAENAKKLLDTQTNVTETQENMAKLDRLVATLRLQASKMAAKAEGDKADRSLLAEMEKGAWEKERQVEAERHRAEIAARNKTIAELQKEKEEERKEQEQRSSQKERELEEHITAVEKRAVNQSSEIAALQKKISQLEKAGKSQAKTAGAADSSGGIHEPKGRNVVVMGSTESGRSALVARLARCKTLDAVRGAEELVLWDAPGLIGDDARPEVRIASTVNVCKLLRECGAPGVVFVLVLDAQSLSTQSVQCSLELLSKMFSDKTTLAAALASMLVCISKVDPAKRETLHTLRDLVLGAVRGMSAEGRVLRPDQIVIGDPLEAKMEATSVERGIFQQLEKLPLLKSGQDTFKTSLSNNDAQFLREVCASTAAEIDARLGKGRFDDECASTLRLIAVFETLRVINSHA
ncbi:hypothetical protein T484DRAFT_1988139 [Baffinella frigidus]|nr:hypothetical protein T484DRAFT_1988139 [Cryptophyta sp. CCMP2293]